MKKLLALSLTFNLLLGAVMWMQAKPGPHNSRLTRHELAGLASNSGAPSGQTNGASSIPKTPWELVESKDLVRFMANLRALGCPERTIRDLVMLRVAREYRDRYLASEAARLRAWDYTRNPDRGQVEDVQWAKEDLRNEMISRIEYLLGEEWQSIFASMMGWPNNGSMAFLTMDERRQVREIERRYRRLTEAIRMGKSFVGLGTDDIARLEELKSQKLGELESILSPQSYEEYFNRRSPEADYVRSNLPAAKSESEFRTMVRVARELGMVDPAAPFASRRQTEADDKAASRAEEERKALFNQRLKEALGEQRIAEQQAEEAARKQLRQKEDDERSREEGRIKMAEVAASVGISDQDAQRFFNRMEELKPILERKSEELEKSFTGSREEKSRQLKAIVKVELEKIAVETLGEQGRALVEKLAK